MQKSLITKTLVCGILVLFIGAGALTSVGEVPENIDVGTKEDVLCGDCNFDGVVNIGDVICMCGIWLPEFPPDLGCESDVNNDGLVNVGDIVYLVNYLFRGGAPPNPDCCNPPWP